MASTPSSSAPGALPAPAPKIPFATLKQVITGEREPRDEHEANAVLLEIARRKSGLLPAEWLVKQVSRVTEGTDWPSRRAALDAVLRRLSFAARDGLSVAERPDGERLLGRYMLAGAVSQGLKRAPKELEKRPYKIAVYSLEPLAVSCDCADFLRSSLGVCKHAMVVLEDIAKRSRGRTVQEAQARPALSWDSVRSWSGPGDRLEGLRWATASTPRDPLPAPLARALELAHHAFENGTPRAATLTDLEQRHSLIEALRALLAAEHVDAEPAAAVLLGEELERCARRRAGRAAADAGLAQLGSLRRELYPYQLQGIRRFLEEQRLLLADDMGLGKTTQAIAACHALFESGQVQRGLLIVPAALKAQWAREWESTTERAPLVSVDGRADEREKIYAQTTRGFVLTNYELLLRDLPTIQRFAPDLVIVDEAQRLKNWASKSSAYVMALQPRWRLVLTGTPMENRLEELATLLDWVDDTALAPKWRLAPWHTAWGTRGLGERVGARHLDTLRERLAPSLLRRVRRDVLSQLPPRSDVRVPVEMTSQQREEHDARSVPIAQLLQMGRRRALRQPEFLRLMQLLAQQRIASNGVALLRFDEVWPTYSRAPADEALLASTSSPKLLELRRLLSELVLEQGRKVVVFSQWRKMLRLAEWAVRDVLASEGLSSVFFTGEESQALRTQNVAVFHDDPSVRVMFLSDAGGVGLNLQHAANACINLELPWNPAVLEQRIGRIYRLGQRDPIDVINLVSEYGIEARIAGLLGNKKALFDGLFDGTTDTVRFDGPSGFLQEVERIVEPVTVPELPTESELRASDEALDLGDDAASETPPAQVEASPPRETSRPTDATPRAPLDVPSLLARLSVTRTESGGLRIEAPPEAADELARLLDGLSQLVRGGNAPEQPR